MTHRRRTEVDAELLAELQRRADEQGRVFRDMVDEAFRYYLAALDRPRRPDELNELLAQIDREQRERGVEPLSEEEAMRLAVEEQHAARRERAKHERVSR